MTNDRADRLRQSVAGVSGGPAALADAVVDRLQHIEVKGAFPVDFARKGPALTAALDMVITNADLAGEIRATLSRSEVPVVGDLKNETLASLVRAEMLAAIRDATGEPWDDALREDWADVVDTVAGAMFGAADATGA